MQVRTDDDGVVFIDRDPTHFQHILNFLRGGIVPSIDNESQRQSILCEADFYNIRPLIVALKGSCNRAFLIGAANAKMEAGEEKLRCTFAQDRSHADISNPLVMLVDVFKNLGQFRFCAPGNTHIYSHTDPDP